MMEMDLFRQASFTRVVNVKKEPCEVYCGRAVPGGGFPVASLWANRHRLETEGERPMVLKLYEDELDADPVRLCRLVELRGKALGCWCAPKPCHCDILARRADSPAAEILTAHFRARRTFGRDNTPPPGPAEWLRFLKHHLLVPERVEKWALLSEEEATAALWGLARVHAPLPPMDKGRPVA